MTEKLINPMKNRLLPRVFGRTLTSLAACAAFLVSGTLHAQSAGTLAGRVADSDAGVGLPGAQVTIVGTGLDTATNRQGEFIIGNVPAGTYTVEVSYLGFGRATETVTIQPGVRTPLNVGLRSTDVVQLETLEVAGIRDGAGRALNLQRTAGNMMNVISADSIGQFPDPNVAEALQRVVGVGVQRDQGEGRYIQIRGAPMEFTTVTIDGVSVAPTDTDNRIVDLDTIPSDVVASMEITKAIRPDQDADSIGGAVNIQTQSPFAYDGRRIRGSFGHGYNELGGTGDTRWNASISNVFGPDNQFGFLVSGSYSRTRRLADNIEHDWGQVDRPEDGAEIWGIEGTDFKDYYVKRTRDGATAQLEWRPSDGHRVYARASFAAFVDNEQRHRIVIAYDDGDLQPGAIDGISATWSGARMTKQIRDVWRKQDIRTLTVGGDHQLNNLSFDYSVSLSVTESDRPHRQELLYRTSANITASYDLSQNIDLPRMSVIDEGLFLETDRFGFRENTWRSELVESDEVAYEVNGRVPMTLGGHGSVLKFGAKLRSVERDFDSDRWRDRSGGSAPASLADLLGVPSSNFGLDLGRMFDADKVRAHLDAMRPTAPQLIPASTTADYFYNEDILAGYGMAEIDVGNLDVIVGLRVEHTDWSADAFRFNEDTEQAVLQGAGRKYTDYFPGLHLRYAFNDSLQGRLAFTRAINRPGYSHLVPRIVENDPAPGGLLQVSKGNPDLKQTLSNNVDLSLEYYFEPIGLVSGAVFYKDVDNYRFNARFMGTFEGEEARITQPQNASGGRIIGAELAYQQQFVNLPGALSGFGVFSNFTWTDSEIDAPIRDPNTGLDTLSRKVRFPGQSKTLLNLSVFYDKYGFNARLSWTDRSDYIDSISISGGPEADAYWEGRGQLDFTASYQISRRYQLFFEAKNLTDTVGLRYDGVRQRVQELEKFGVFYFGGIRVNL